MRPLALRTDRVVLPAFDLRATFRFYGEILQLPLIDAVAGDDWGGQRWRMLVFSVRGGGQIALTAIEGAAPPADRGAPDVRGIAFAATKEGFEAWKRRLRAEKVPYHAKDHGNRQSIYFEDPNGTTLEIATPSETAVVVPNPAAIALVESWLAENA